MSLDLESRTLLADIYGAKPNKQVAIKKRLYSNGFMEMIEGFQKKKMIKDLAILEDGIESRFFGHSNEKGTVYSITFIVRNWQKLDEFGESEFNKLVTEPYGKEKQLKIVRKTIIDKAIRLENNQFRIDDDDFPYSGKKHIIIFEVLDELKKEGFLESLDGNFYIDTGDFDCDIKLLWDITKLKKEVQIRGMWRRDAGAFCTRFNTK